MVITEETIWSSGSTISLTENVQVASGTTLIIEPGVFVIGNGHQIEIFGDLFALGTEDQKITIENLSLDFADYHSVSAYSDEKPSIRMHNVEFSGGNLFYAWAAYGRFEIVGSKFEGVDGGYLRPYSGSKIEQSIFEKCAGWYIETRDGLNIENNVIIDPVVDFKHEAAITTNTSRSVVVKNNTFDTGDVPAISIPDSGITTRTIDVRENFFIVPSDLELSDLLLDNRDDLARVMSLEYVEDITLNTPHAETPNLYTVLTLSINKMNNLDVVYDSEFDHNWEIKSNNSLEKLVMGTNNSSVIISNDSGAIFVTADHVQSDNRLISSADALDALRLSVGMELDNGKANSLNFIAADFNRDGKVTSSDALDILKYAVGLETEHDAEWVFIRSDDDLSAVGKNSVEYDTNIWIEDINSDTEIGLVGILIGDVNDSYSNFNSLPTGDVNILGTLVPYETLSVDAESLSDANGLGPFTYQWLRDGTSIPKATLSEYTLQPIDNGSVISVSLSYTDGGGNTETVTSNTTDTVQSYYSGVVYIDGNIGAYDKTYQALETWSEGSLSKNYSSSTQIGTDIQVDIADKFKSEFVFRGEPNNIQLPTDETSPWDGPIHEIILNTDWQNVEDAPGYAIFLHDSNSDFPDGTELTVDSFGNLSTQRIYGITDISGSAGDDVINLTSPEYSLSAHTILIGAGNGDDIIWGSDADERIDGQNGNDIIFGGAGNNRLEGGPGADEFQFTGTSTNDTLLDFNISEGDTLRFFNTGPSEFDRSTLSLNQESGELSIKYGEQLITLTFENMLPTLSDLTPDVLII